MNAILNRNDFLIILELIANDATEERTLGISVETANHLMEFIKVLVSESPSLHYEEILEYVEQISEIKSQLIA